MTSSMTSLKCFGKNGFVEGYSRDSTFLVANDILGMPKNIFDEYWDLFKLIRYIDWTPLIWQLTLSENSAYTANTPILSPSMWYLYQ